MRRRGNGRVARDGSERRRMEVEGRGSEMSEAKVWGIEGRRMKRDDKILHSEGNRPLRVLFMSQIS